MRHPHAMLLTRFIAFGLVLSVASIAALAGPLPTDPNALPGWQGSQPFTGTLGAFTLNSSVQFAVYAPGQFGASAALGFPAAADPSGGTDYVYAYEIFNNDAGNSIVINLSVALVTGAIPNGSTRVGNAPGTPEGGIVPDLSQFIPATDPKHNAKWTFSPTLLNPGSHSDILLFTSPFGPTTLQSAMQGGHGTTASALLPTPIPEPASAFVMFSGFLCLAAAHWCRTRRLRRRACTPT